jgi:hypothetical protein
MLVSRYKLVQLVEPNFTAEGVDYLTVEGVACLNAKGVAYFGRRRRSSNPTENWPLAFKKTWLNWP